MIHTHMYVCVRTYIHTYIHTYIYIYNTHDIFPLFRNRVSNSLVFLVLCWLFQSPAARSGQSQLMAQGSGALRMVPRCTQQGMGSSATLGYASPATTGGSRSAPFKTLSSRPERPQAIQVAKGVSTERDRPRVSEWGLVIVPFWSILGILDITS